MSWLQKVLKVLGKVTDVLIRGRQAGLWTEKQTPGSSPSSPLGSPHKPEDTRGIR